MNKWAERLFDYIKDQNITQKDVAYMLGVSRNTLTNWKNGGEVDSKNAEAIKRFTEDWQEKKPEIDAVTKAILETLSGLSLVDRCRLLAFADDLKNEKNKQKPASPHCPNCKAELPADWEVGKKYECPSCG